MQRNLSTFYVAVVAGITSLFLAQIYAPIEFKPLTNRLLDYPGNTIPTVLQIYQDIPRIQFLRAKVKFSWSPFKILQIARVSTEEGDVNVKVALKPAKPVAVKPKPTNNEEEVADPISVTPAPTLTPPPVTVTTIQQDVYTEINGTETLRYGYQLTAADTYVDKANGETCTDGQGTISGTYCAPNGTRYNVANQDTADAAATFNQKVAEKVATLSNEEVAQVASTIQNNNCESTDTACNTAIVASAALTIDDTKTIEAVVKTQQENQAFQDKIQEFLDPSKNIQALANCGNDPECPTLTAEMYLKKYLGVIDTDIQKLLDTRNQNIKATADLNANISKYLDFSIDTAELAKERCGTNQTCLRDFRRDDLLTGLDKSSEDYKNIIAQGQVYLDNIAKNQLAQNRAQEYLTLSYEELAQKYCPTGTTADRCESLIKEGGVLKAAGLSSDVSQEIVNQKLAIYALGQYESGSLVKATKLDYQTEYEKQFNLCQTSMSQQGLSANGCSQVASSIAQNNVDQQTDSQAAKMDIRSKESVALITACNTLGGTSCSDSISSLDSLGQLTGIEGNDAVYIQSQKLKIEAENIAYQQVAKAYSGQQEKLENFTQAVNNQDTTWTEINEITQNLKKDPLTATVMSWNNFTSDRFSYGNNKMLDAAGGNGMTRTMIAINLSNNTLGLVSADTFGSMMGLENHIDKWGVLTGGLIQGGDAAATAVLFTAAALPAAGALGLSAAGIPLLSTASSVGIGGFLSTGMGVAATTQMTSTAAYTCDQVGTNGITQANCDSARNMAFISAAGTGLGVLSQSIQLVNNGAALAKAGSLTQLVANTAKAAPYLGKATSYANIAVSGLSTVTFTEMAIETCGQPGVSTLDCSSSIMMAVAAGTGFASSSVGSLINGLDPIINSTESLANAAIAAKNTSSLSKTASGVLQSTHVASSVLFAASACSKLDETANADTLAMCAMGISGLTNTAIDTSRRIAATQESKNATATKSTLSTEPLERMASTKELELLKSAEKLTELQKRVTGLEEIVNGKKVSGSVLKQATESLLSARAELEALQISLKPTESVSQTSTSEKIVASLSKLQDGKTEIPVKEIAISGKTEKAYEINVEAIASPEAQTAAKQINELIRGLEADANIVLQREQVEAIVSKETITQLKAADGASLKGKTAVITRILSLSEPRTMILTENATSAKAYVDAQVLSPEGKKFYARKGAKIIVVDAERGFLEVDMASTNFDRGTAKPVSAEQARILLEASQNGGQNVVFVADYANAIWTRIGGNETGNLNAFQKLFGSKEALRAEGILMKEIAQNKKGQFLFIADEISSSIYSNFANSAAGKALKNVTDGKLLGGVKSGSEAISLYNETVSKSKTHIELVAERMAELKNGQAQSSKFKLTEKGKAVPESLETHANTMAEVIELSLNKTNSRSTSSGKALEAIAERLKNSSTANEALKELDAFISSNSNTKSSLLTDLNFRKSSIQEDWNQLARIPGTEFAQEGSNLVLRKENSTTGERLSSANQLISFYEKGKEMLKAYTGEMVEGTKFNPNNLPDIADIQISPKGSQMTVQEFFKELGSAGHNIKGLDATPLEAIHALNLPDRVIETPIKIKNLFVEKARSTVAELFAKERVVSHSKQASAIVFDRNNPNVSRDILEIVQKAYESGVGYETLVLAQNKKSPNGQTVEEFIQYEIGTRTNEKTGKTEAYIVTEKPLNLENSNKWNDAITNVTASNPEKVLIAINVERGLDLATGLTKSGQLHWSEFYDATGNAKPTSVGAEQNWRRDRLFGENHDVYLVTEKTGLTRENVWQDFFVENLNNKLAENRFQDALSAIAKSPESALTALDAFAGRELKLNWLERMRFERLKTELSREASSFESLINSSVSREGLQGEALMKELYTRAETSNKKILGMYEEAISILKLTPEQAKNLKTEMGGTENFIKQEEFLSQLDKATETLTKPENNSPDAVLKAYAANNSTSEGANPRYKAVAEQHLSGSQSNPIVSPATAAAPVTQTNTPSTPSLLSRIGSSISSIFTPRTQPTTTSTATTPVTEPVATRTTITVPRIVSIPSLITLPEFKELVLETDYGSTFTIQNGMIKENESDFSPFNPELLPLAIDVTNIRYNGNGLTTNNLTGAGLRISETKPVEEIINSTDFLSLEVDNADGTTFNISKVGDKLIFTETFAANTPAISKEFEISDLDKLPAQADETFAISYNGIDLPLTAIEYTTQSEQTPQTPSADISLFSTAISSLTSRIRYAFDWIKSINISEQGQIGIPLPGLFTQLKPSSLDSINSKSQKQIESDLHNIANELEGLDVTHASTEQLNSISELILNIFDKNELFLSQTQAQQVDYLTIRELLIKIRFEIDRINQFPIDNWRITAELEDISVYLDKLEPYFANDLNKTKYDLDRQSIFYLTTGIKLHEGNEQLVINQMKEDHKLVRIKYGLGDKNIAFKDPLAYYSNLMKIIKSYNINVVDVKDDPNAPIDNPYFTAYNSEKNEIVMPLSQDLNSDEKLLDVIFNLEHEYIHARQYLETPNMPIEMKEYEAYIAAQFNLELADIHPLETVKNFLIIGSIDYYYEYQLKLEPSWRNKSLDEITPMREYLRTPSTPLTSRLRTGFNSVLTFLNQKWGDMAGRGKLATEQSVQTNVTQVIQTNSNLPQPLQALAITTRKIDGVWNIAIPIKSLDRIDTETNIQPDLEDPNQTEILYRLDNYSEEVIVDNKYRYDVYVDEDTDTLTFHLQETLTDTRTKEERLVWIAEQRQNAINLAQETGGEFVEFNGESNLVGAVIYPQNKNGGKTYYRAVRVLSKEALANQAAGILRDTRNKEVTTYENRKETLPIAQEIKDQVLDLVNDPTWEKYDNLIKTAPSELSYWMMTHYNSAKKIQAENPERTLQSIFAQLQLYTTEGVTGSTPYLSLFEDLENNREKGFNPLNYAYNPNPLDGNTMNGIIVANVNDENVYVPESKYGERGEVYAKGILNEKDIVAVLVGSELINDDTTAKELAELNSIVQSRLSPTTPSTVTTPPTSPIRISGGMVVPVDALLQLGKDAGKVIGNIFSQITKIPIIVRTHIATQPITRNLNTKLKNDRNYDIESIPQGYMPLIRSIIMKDSSTDPEFDGILVLINTLESTKPELRTDYINKYLPHWIKYASDTYSASSLIRTLNNTSPEIREKYLNNPIDEWLDLFIDLQDIERIIKELNNNPALIEQYIQYIPNWGGRSSADIIKSLNKDPKYNESIIPIIKNLIGSRTYGLDSQIKLLQTHAEKISSVFPYIPDWEITQFSELNEILSALSEVPINATLISPYIKGIKLHKPFQVSSYYLDIINTLNRNPETIQIIGPHISEWGKLTNQDGISLTARIISIIQNTSESRRSRLLLKLPSVLAAYNSNKKNLDEFVFFLTKLADISDEQYMAIEPYIENWLNTIFKTNHFGYGALDRAVEYLTNTPASRRDEANALLQTITSIPKFNETHLAINIANELIKQPQYQDEMIAFLKTVGENTKNSYPNIVNLLSGMYKNPHLIPNLLPHLTYWQQQQADPVIIEKYYEFVLQRPQLTPNESIALLFEQNMYNFEFLIPLTDEVLDNLPEEYQKYRVHWQVLIDNPSLRNAYISQNREIIEQFYSLDPSQLQIYVELVSKIEESPIALVQKIKVQLIAQLLNTDDPIQTYNNIDSVLTRNNIPEYFKLKRIFDYLYPKEILDQKITNISSPTLQKEKQDGIRRFIIQRDLFRAYVESGNRQLLNYLQIFRDHARIVDNFMLGKDFDAATIASVKVFITKLDALYKSSNLIHIRPAGLTLDSSLLSNQNDLRQYLKDTVYVDLDIATGESLNTRIEELFLANTGYDNFESIIKRMQTVITEANARNQLFARQNTRLTLESGDLTKGMQISSAPNSVLGIIESGPRSRELMGEISGTDKTPLDTDLSMTTPEDALSGFEVARERSLAKEYGNLTLVIKQLPGRFYRSDLGENSDRGMFELFITGVTDKDRHVGIRSIFPATYIDAYINNGLSDIELETLYQSILFDGEYVPVYSKEGNLIFTTEMYQSRLKFFTGIHGQQLVVKPLESNDIFHQMITINKLDHDLAQNSQNIARVEKPVREKIAKILKDLGINLADNPQEASLTDAVLLNIGSSGRGTNLPNDYDFDYTLVLNRRDFKLSQQIAKSLKSAFEYKTEEGSSTNQVRLGQVNLSEVDTTIDLDVGITTREDSLLYSSNEAVTDRLESLNNKDRQSTVANILLTKMLLKEGHAYKAYEDGGFGGIGVENWLLSNRGNIREAFETFWVAAHDDYGNVIAFEQFQKIYPIYDAGINLRDQRFDNYIYKLKENGYQNMLIVIDRYLHQSTTSPSLFAAIPAMTSLGATSGQSILSALSPFILPLMPDIPLLSQNISAWVEHLSFLQYFNSISNKQEPELGPDVRYPEPTRLPLESIKNLLSPFSDWLDSKSSLLDSYLQNRYKPTGTTGQYISDLNAVVKIVNTQNQKDFTISSPLSEIADEANKVLEKEFVTGIELTGGRALSQIKTDHPAQIIEEIFSAPKLLFNTSGNRVSINDYIQDRYRELIVSGVKISIEYLSPQDAIDKSRYTGDKLNLNEGILSGLNSLNVKIPTIKITTPEGFEFFTPIVNDPITLKKSSAYGMFSYGLDSSHILTRGKLALKASTLYDVDSPNNLKLLASLTTTLHEIDHAIYNTIKSSHISAIKAERNDLLVHTDDIIRTAILLLTQKGQTDLPGFRDSIKAQLYRKNTDDDWNRLISNLDQTEINIIKLAYGENSQEHLKYLDLIKQKEELSASYEKMLFQFENLSPIINEGLSTRAEVAFLNIQKYHLSSVGLSSTDLIKLFDFAIFQTTILRNASNPSLAIYSVGYDLITDPNDTAVLASADIYLSDLTSKYLQENSSLFLAAMQYNINKAIDIDQMLNPDLNESERMASNLNIAKLTLKNEDIFRVVNQANLPGLMTAVKDYSGADANTKAEIIKDLESQITADGSGDNLSAWKNATENQQQYFEILVSYVHTIMPLKSITENILNIRYDFSAELGKLSEYIDQVKIDSTSPQVSPSVPEPQTAVSIESNNNLLP